MRSKGSCVGIRSHGRQLRRMSMNQSTEIQLDFAMFDFAKMHMARPNSDNGLNDFRMLLNRDKTALSTASTKTMALPGSGQTNFIGS